MHKRGKLVSFSHSAGRRFGLSEYGFTLTEIVATTAIAAVVVIGMGMFFSDMFLMQKRGNTVNAITQLRQSIIAAVSEDSEDPLFPSPWNMTIADATGGTGNPDMACIFNHSPCQNNLTRQLNLKTRNGTATGGELFYARMPQRGFDVSGRLCNTFSMINADRACPFRYELTWKSNCVDGTTSEVVTDAGVIDSCVNPQIQITGVLLFSGPNDILGGQPMNLDTYRISTIRGQTTPTNIPISLAYVVDEAAAGLAGEGVCNVAAPGVARKFNTITSDPSSSVSLGPGAPPDSFILNQGHYVCRIEAPAFKTGWNKISLVGGAYNLTASGMASPKGGFTTVVLQATLTLTAPTTFHVYHQCEKSAGWNAPYGTANNNWSLGVPVPAMGDYTKVTYSVVNCMKTG